MYRKADGSLTCPASGGGYGFVPIRPGATPFACPGEIDAHPYCIVADHPAADGPGATFA